MFRDVQVGARGLSSSTLAHFVRCFGAVALTLAGCGHFQATAPVALGGNSANPGLFTWERYRLLTSPPDRERKLGELLDSWNAGNDWHKEHVLGTLCDAELADSAVLNVLAQHVRKNPQLILEFARIRDVVECRVLSQSHQPLDETSRELMNDSEYLRALETHRKRNPNFDNDLDAPLYSRGQRVKKDSPWPVELMYQSWFVLPERTTSLQIVALIDVAIHFNRSDLILETDVDGPKHNLNEQWDYARTWMRDNARYFVFDHATCTFSLDEFAKQRAQPVDCRQQSSWPASGMGSNTESRTAAEPASVPLTLEKAPKSPGMASR